MRTEQAAKGGLGTLAKTRGSGDSFEIHVQAGALGDWYEAELVGSALAGRTRAEYARQVRSYAAWLIGRPTGVGDALGDARARDWAVRDWRSEMLEGGRSASGTNVALAAIDDCYARLGFGRSDAVRERPPAPEARALTLAEERAVLRHAEGDARLGAIVALLGFAGLRVGELVVLQREDLVVSERKGHVVVRQGKGGHRREVPLAPAARRLVQSWLEVRGTGAGPLFPGRAGDGHLVPSSVRRCLAQLGDRAGVERLSPHVLRHTYCTRMLRAGVDIVAVAQLAGHARIETTRRYGLANRADLAEAASKSELDW